MKILAKQRLKAAWWNDPDYNYESGYDTEDDPIKRLINRYIENGYGLSNSVVEEAISYYYPNVEPLILYRGLNFTTQKKYESFIEQIHNGILTTNSPTSWSKSKTIAEEFAKSKQFNLSSGGSSYFLDEFKKAESVDGGGISGYRGILLTTRIKPNEGLDLDKHKLNVSEREVILPEGKYKVDVIEIKTFKDEYAGKTPSEVLRNLTDSSKFLSVLEWFKKQGLDAEELDQEIKQKIAINSNARKEADRISSRFDDVYTKENGIKYHSIAISILHMPNLEELRWYDDKTQDYILDSLKRVIKDAIRKASKEAVNRSFPELIHFSKVEWLFDIDYFVKEFRLQSDIRALERKIELAHKTATAISNKKYKSAEDAFVGYNKLNSLDNIRRIESIQDPVKRYKAFEQYKADILNAIQQIGKN